VKKKCKEGSTSKEANCIPNCREHHHTKKLGEEGGEIETKKKVTKKKKKQKDIRNKTAKRAWKAEQEQKRKLASITQQKKAAQEAWEQRGLKVSKQGATQYIGQEGGGAYRREKRSAKEGTAEGEEARLSGCCVKQPRKKGTWKKGNNRKWSAGDRKQELA